MPNDIIPPVMSIGETANPVASQLAVPETGNRTDSEAVSNPEPPAPLPKTADRPHWITIAIGLVSPSLALVALYVSLKTLSIGQRAYITSTLEMKQETAPRFQRQWEVGVRFKNSGNTPGTITALSVTAEDEGCEGDPYYIYGRYTEYMEKFSKQYNDDRTVSEAAINSHLPKSGAGVFRGDKPEKKQEGPKVQRETCEAKRAKIISPDSDLNTSVGGREDYYHEVMLTGIGEQYAIGSNSFSSGLPPLTVRFTYVDIFSISHSSVMRCTPRVMASLITAPCSETGD